MPALPPQSIVDKFGMAVWGKEELGEAQGRQDPARLGRSANIRSGSWFSGLLGVAIDVTRVSIMEP
jgi:hypothetical protein